MKKSNLSIQLMTIILLLFAQSINSQNFGNEKLENARKIPEKITQKVLILLNNSADIPALTNWIENATVRSALHIAINSAARTFEDIKTGMQGNGKYSKVIYLTDTKCTTHNLKRELINQTNLGNSIDLVFYGHGGKESWALNNSNLTSNMLRNWKKSFGRNFNLRMVYTCACYASTMNDDWLSVGADVSVGSTELNFMPEPKITFFLENFLSGKTVSESARNAFQQTKFIFLSIPWIRQIMFDTHDTFTRLESSRLLVCGKKNLRMRDLNDYETVNGNCLSLESKYDLKRGMKKNVNIYANKFHNHTGIYLEKGHKYKFKVKSYDKWKNNRRKSNANGYKRGIFDLIPPRQPNDKLMVLEGELFGDFKDKNSYLGRHFKIGTSKTYTAPIAGWLVCYANDVSYLYGDNSGKVKLTVKRIK